MTDRAPQQIFQQLHMPEQASRGDVWTDGETFKRVYSRGGAWENCNLGSKHPDEDWPEGDSHVEQESGPETGGHTSEVSLGTSEPASGDGDDGQDPAESGEGQESAPLIEEDSDVRDDDEGEGIDANGSPVL